MPSGLSIHELAEAIGGQDGCDRLARVFYQNVESEPELRAMYPKHLGCPISALSAFIWRLVGGKSDWPSQPLFAVHRRFKIGEELRDAWLRSMSQALEETVLDERCRIELSQMFSEAATHLMNQQPLDEGDDGRGPMAKSPLAYAWARHGATDQALLHAASGNAEALTSVLPNLCVSLESILLVAAKAGNVSCIQVLLDAGADARRVSVSGELLVSHPDRAEYLLSLGATVNGLDDQEPPLIRSCRGDRGERLSEVLALLQRGANVSERGREGRTALHYAARAGFLRVAQALVERGAPVQAVDDKGLTPRQHAVIRRKPEVAGYLALQEASLPKV